MDPIKSFFQKHGAVPVDERRGTGWASMATPDLRRWLADYQKMIETKSSPDARPLDDYQIDQIRSQVRRIEEILATCS